jgi:ferredoxin--NADP+ reductase
MVDGTGMCGGCRATVDNKTVFVCVDGPEFDAHLVDFETLLRRNSAYRDMENQSLEIHKCNLEKAIEIL